MRDSTAEEVVIGRKGETEGRRGVRRGSTGEEVDGVVTRSTSRDFCVTVVSIRASLRGKLKVYVTLP